MSGNVFKRRELKFILTKDQFRSVVAEIGKRMLPDKFGKSVIQSLYYDTPDYRLISRSMEKPDYKEKIRARCYNLNTGDGEVFLELKKKYDGVVFKRRIRVKESDLVPFFKGENVLRDGQIEKEITYFRDFYRSLRPAMLILYDRTAFFDENSDLRVTFDENVRYRTENLNLSTSLDGKIVTDKILMEIKSGSAMPLWLSELLSEHKIYKTSFSKYGAAYASFVSEKAKPFSTKIGVVSAKPVDSAITTRLSA